MMHVSTKQWFEQVPTMWGTIEVAKAQNTAVHHMSCLD